LLHALVHIEEICCYSIQLKGDMNFDIVRETSTLSLHFTLTDNDDYWIRLYICRH